MPSIMDKITEVIGNLQKKRVLRYMSGRDPLTPEQFGRKFFPPEKARVAARIRELLARHVPIDLARLHPDDHLLNDLHLQVLNSMSLFQFRMDLEEEYCIFFEEEEEYSCHSFRDIVEYVIVNSRPKPVPVATPMPLKKTGAFHAPVLPATTNQRHIH